MKKRILSLFMALVLCLTFLPVSAFAEAESNGEGNDGSKPTEVETIVSSVSEGGDSGKPENEVSSAPVVENEEPDGGDGSMSGNGSIGGETGGTGGGVLIGGNEGQGGEGGMSGNENIGGETGGTGGGVLAGGNEGQGGEGSMSGNETRDGENGASGGETGGTGDGNEQPGGGVFEPIDEENDPPAFEEAEKTEIWCVKKTDSIGRAYDGTTDGSTIAIMLWFTSDGTDEIELTEGVDFTAVKTFDSADAGSHTVSVEITLIGEAANQYKLKAGEEKFEIKGTIDQAVPALTVSLSQTTCETGEKILPLLSISGVEEEAAVTYYYTQFKSLVGNSEYEGTYIPVLDENISIDALDEENGNTYYIYAKTAATVNYKEGMSEPVELTIMEKVDPAVSILLPDGTDEEYDSLPAAIKAVQNGGFIRLNKDVTVNAGELDEGLTAENALAVSGKTFTLNLNGYVLESDDVPMTVKNGAALYIANADADKTEKTTKIGLNLKIQVEKGGTFACSSGKIKTLQLQNAGAGDYKLRLTNGAQHSTIGFLLSEDAAITVDDVLKVNHSGMALHAENTGSAIQIEKSTPINQIASETNSFYVGACSGHEAGEDSTCVYCGAAVEVDTCIAHATVSGSDYVWHFETLDDIVYQISNKWIKMGTVTVKFLTDVTVDKTFSIEQCNTDIVFDLDGHTLSGSLDVPVMEANYLYGATGIAIQNGTIQNTGSGAALRLSYGATTLKNVNVTGSLILAQKLIGSTNYVPTFLGGGEFSKITYDAYAGNMALFSVMLPQGYYFAHIGDKNRILGDSLAAGESITNVTVLPCNHKDADGNYVFTVKIDSYGNLSCSICGNICPHAHKTQNENGSLHCEDCGLTLKAVRIYYGEETYYPSFDNATSYIGANVTIKVLCDDLDTTTLRLGNGAGGTGTLDLNGHTLAERDKSEQASIPYISGPLIIKNTAGSAGKYECDHYIKVDDGKLIIPAAENNLTISAVEMQENGNAELAGGSFGSIRIGENSSKKLTDLLVSGYYYADTTTGAPAAMYDVNGNAVTELTNVTVTKCSHSEAVCNPDGAWICPCGQVTFAASVTKDGATTCYADLQDAFNAADGGMVKLLKNVVDVTVNTEKPFTFDLNGYDVYSLTVNSKITIVDSAAGKGRIAEWLIAPSGMTIGDLLEEGYAFKNADRDEWHRGTEQRVGNVSVKRVPIDSVTALNPTVVVEYGKTSEVTLTATVVLSDEEGTFSCQWYRAGGTLQPVEGATGSSYQLPDDLSGNCTYCLVVKKDGYEKECEFSVTVTPISIADADVTVKNPTYNGGAQTPTVTVKLGEKVLTENKDYTVTVTAQTDAGSYQLTINGRGGYNGAIENVDWKIDPLKIDHVMFAKDISKTYDGNAVFDLVPADKASYLKFYGEYTMEVSVPTEAYEISDVRFMEKNADGEIVDSPEAGSKDWITFTITLNSSNYVLQGYYDEQPASSKTENQCGGANFTINQASAPSLSSIWFEQYVFNDLAKTYDVELEPMLNVIRQKLPVGCEFGAIEYTAPYSVDLTDNAYFGGTAALIDGVLSLPIASANTSKGEIGKASVTIKTTNYQTFALPIYIIARDKFVPDQSGVTFSATDINYGQTLSESNLTVTGSMKDIRNGEEIKGTFAWKDGTIQPNAGSYEAEWMFTPAEGYEEYAAATGTVTITVHKVDSTFTAPTANALTYNGYAQFLLSEGSTQDGTMMYRLGEDGEFTDSIPTAKDAGTYTVYYKVAGDGNHNDTEAQPITVTIDPMRIKGISNIDPVTKAYDGTADAPIDKSTLKFYSERESNIVLPDDAFTITNARFTMLQADNSYQDSPEAGEGKSLSFTLTITSGNYVLLRSGQVCTTDDYDIATDDAQMFTITQAAAPTNIQNGALNVINGTKLEYTYDAKQLLPDAPKGTYGKVFYNCAFPFNLENGYSVDDIEIADSVLTLTIDALNGGQTGKIGTIPVYVTTDNYGNFNLPLDLYAVDKITPVVDGKITASEITYGDALSKSEISGKMKDSSTGEEVKGTFAWKDGTVTPDAGDYEADWTFTPAEGYEKYAVATGTVTITVNKADAAFTAPTANALTYNGYAQFLLSEGSTQDGTMLYRLGEDGEFTDSIPTGKDAGTYTVYYKVAGDGNHNDTEKQAITVTIDPMKLLRYINVAPVEKEYDGTAAAPLSKGAVMFNSRTASSIVLPESAFTITNARFTRLQADNSYQDSPEAGEGKSLCFTVTLTSDNYVFEGNPESKTIDCTIATDDVKMFTITKADLRFSGIIITKVPVQLLVINDLEKTYEIDLPSYRWPLASPCEYGNISYTLTENTLSSDYYSGGAMITDENKLIVPINKVSTDREVVSFGKLIVTVTSDNYKDYIISVDTYPKNKAVPVPDGDISASEITYGEALSESKIMGKMKDPSTGEEVKGTFAWKDGTVTPDAGDYEAEWTFTPAEGYEKYATATGKVTITVNKVDSAFTAPTANTLTYNGYAQFLLSEGSTQDGTMMYRLGEDGEFTASIPTAKDAGTYTVYYKVVGDSNHNDTAEQSITVTIKPMELSRFVLGIDSLTKAYDGTALASLDKDEIEFRSNGRIVLLPEDAYDLTNARFTMRANGSYKDSPEAGEGKSLSFTVTIKSDNYVFEGNEGSKTLECNIFTGEAKSFTITKAPAPAADGVLTIINDLHKTYSFELSALLPKLASPGEYGTITYGKPDTDLGVGSFVTLVNSKTGALTLEVFGRSSDEEGQFGTIKVPVTTDNYQEFILTINVIAENKIVPQVDGAVTAADITYDQTLNDSAITGKMKHPATGEEITGTFAWKDGTVKPDAGSYTAEWTFTPDESYGGIYAAVTGYVNVQVDRATQYGAVSMAGYTYGETPSTPTLTGRTGDPDAPVTYYYSDGSVVKEWNISNPPALNAGTYQMFAEIAQTDNYYGFEAVYCEFVVAKATRYTIPTGLTAKYGQTLSDVTLPDGWTWMDGSELVGDASTTARTFKAKFTPEDTANYNTVENIDLEVTVHKADGRNLATIDLSQKYTDEQEHTFEADWSALPEGQNWIFGSTYSRSEGSNAQLPRLENTIDGSKLIYVIADGKAGDMVTITLKATCDNYEDFTITLRVALLDRDDQAALTIIGNTSVVYGDTLTLTATGGSGTGDVTYHIDDAISTGEATIDPVTGVLTTVKVGSVSIIASKAGDNEYKDAVSAPFVIMILPATSTGEPNYKKITAGGKTLKDAGLTSDGSTLNPNAGKLEWVDDQNNVLPDDTIVEANKTYRWRFTPDDTNYTALTGEAVLYRVYTIQATAETGGSISPSGNVRVDDGADQVFTITPDKGYAISNVKIDGRSIGAVKTYTFEDVSRSHTIEAIFMKANGNPQTGVFVDAATGRYYDDEMDWAAENGID